LGALMENSESVKSVKSEVKFLWLRLAALGLLRLFAANPQSPHHVQSCRSYDFCAATMAFFARFHPFRSKSMEVPIHE
jgi:hypothetical protein